MGSLAQAATRIAYLPPASLSLHSAFRSRQQYDDIYTHVQQHARERRCQPEREHNPRRAHRPAATGIADRLPKTDNLQRRRPCATTTSPAASQSPATIRTGAASNRRPRAPTATGSRSGSWAPTASAPTCSRGPQPSPMRPASSAARSAPRPHDAATHAYGDRRYAANDRDRRLCPPPVDSRAAALTEPAAPPVFAARPCIRSAPVPTGPRPLSRAGFCTAHLSAPESTSRRPSAMSGPRPRTRPTTRLRRRAERPRVEQPTTTASASSAATGHGASGDDDSDDSGPPTARSAPSSRASCASRPRRMKRSHRHRRDDRRAAAAAQRSRRRHHGRLKPSASNNTTRPLASNDTPQANSTPPLVSSNTTSHRVEQHPEARIRRHPAARPHPRGVQRHDGETASSDRSTPVQPRGHPHPQDNSPIPGPGPRRATVSATRTRDDRVEQHDLTPRRATPIRSTDPAGVRQHVPPARSAARRPTTRRQTASSDRPIPFNPAPTRTGNKTTRPTQDSGPRRAIVPEPATNCDGAESSTRPTRIQRRLTERRLPPRRQPAGGTGTLGSEDRYQHAYSDAPA